MKIGDAPDYLTEQLHYVGEVQPYSFRYIMDFRIQQANTTAKQKSLNKVLNLYNRLTFDVKNEVNDKVFRKKSVIFIRSIY